MSLEKTIQANTEAVEKLITTLQSITVVKGTISEAQIVEEEAPKTKKKKKVIEVEEEEAPKKKKKSKKAKVEVEEDDEDLDEDDDIDLDDLDDEDDEDEAPKKKKSKTKKAKKAKKTKIMDDDEDGSAEDFAKLKRATMAFIKEHGRDALLGILDGFGSGITSIKGLEPHQYDEALEELNDYEDDE